MELCNYTSPDQIRRYEIEAIQIPIVYNKYGDYDPNGLLYVLKKDADRIRQEALRNNCAEGGDRPPSFHNTYSSILSNQLNSLHPFVSNSPTQYIQKLY